MENEIKKVGIGVIGSGSVAEIAHFPSIQQIPEADLVGACDVVEEYAQRGAYRICSSFSDQGKGCQP